MTKLHRTSPKLQKSKTAKKEGNVFDKIFKENIEPLFTPLLRNVLGLKIKSVELLKDKQQTTIERELDFLYKIEDERGRIFILHIEVESGDNPDMIYRLVEYNGIVLRRYKLPIEHVVIYLGEAESKMATQIKFANFFFTFKKVELRKLNTKKLLSSQVPEEVILAVLSNYPKEKVESILRLIRKMLLILCKTEIERTKYFNQLIVLSKLRKIDSLTIKILEEMPVTIDLEDHILVKRGIEKGIEIGEFRKEQADNYRFVKNLILNTDFNNERISLLASVSVEFVEKIRAEIASK